MDIWELRWGELVPIKWLFYRPLLNLILKLSFTLQNVFKISVFNGIFRTVYEGTEPERFLHCLDARINARDKQIQHMCNHHYQGFIESVHSLLQVRSDVDKLKVLWKALLCLT